VFAAYVALLLAGVFTGAASYISFAEQPARLSLDDRALLTEWKIVYRRGFAMQATPAVLACLLGVVAWWITHKVMFLPGQYCSF
jgi:hypothetical protein